MKKAWNVNVNEVVHTIEYKTGFGGAKVFVNGQSYKVKSQNWFVNMVDYPIQIDGVEMRVVVIGTKADLAVNGVYLGSGENYTPLHKMPVVTNVFIGISCIAGFLLCGWLGACIGILFSALYVKLGLKEQIGPMIGAFVGCTVIQIAIMIVVAILSV